MPVVQVLLLLCLIACSCPLGEARQMAAKPFSCASWSANDGRCTANQDGTFNISCLNQRVGFIQSSNHFFYGIFSAKVRFQHGYSGGINHAFYLIDTVTTSNKDPNHSEIDIEVYGGMNSSNLFMGTNVFVDGKQNLANYALPFDGAADDHTFTIIWNPDVIMWLVDGQTYRILNRGGPKTTINTWPNKPMQVQLSTWDTSGFTTLKADYSNGPITWGVKSLSAQGCASASSTEINRKCANRRSSKLPWNVNPTLEQLQKASAASSFFGKGAWGWDKA